LAINNLIEVDLGDARLVGVLRRGAPDRHDVAETSVGVEAPAEARVVVAGRDSAAGLTFPTPLLSENSVVDVYLTGDLDSVLRTAPRVDSLKLLYQDGKGLRHYEIVYRGAVGDVEWIWTTAHGRVQVRWEVFPTKMDYRSNYAAIRRDLAAVAPLLGASLKGHSGSGFESSSTKNADELEWLENIRRHHEALRGALGSMMRNLRLRPKATTILTRSDRLRSLRPVSRRWGASLSAHDRLLTVHSITTSLDTPANRVLKFELERLAGTCSKVLEATWITSVDSSYRDAISALRTDIEEWLRGMPNVRAVPDVTVVAVHMRDPHYAKALLAIAETRLQLEPAAHAELVGLKDLPTLYEYWVFLFVVRHLQSRFGHSGEVQQPLVERIGPETVMTAGRRSAITFTSNAGTRVTCEYNRSFVGLPTTNQRPDAVITVSTSDGYLLLDAKYRLGRDDDYLKRHNTRGPLDEDINVIHRYRDAIVSRTKPYDRLSGAGMIIFPGAKDKTYPRHRFFLSWLAVRVGGFPLLPGNTEMFAEVLDRYLGETVEEFVSTKENE
jgi:hypothetical protein